MEILISYKRDCRVGVFCSKSGRYLQNKFYVALSILMFFHISTVAGQQKNVKVIINLDDTIGRMVPIWASFGYDEPNYTYMKDGKKLLTELSSLGNATVYIRTHHLLTSGDGTAALKWGSTNVYTEDMNGTPVYNWVIVDSIFDTYVKRGLKPIVEIAFMPKALTTDSAHYDPRWLPGQKKGQTVGEVWTGWRNPPKDYHKWAELIYKWVKHESQRYGKNEVESWYWELWNEPNGGYWLGTKEEYFKLYDYTADAVKRALPQAKIGGPHVTGPDTKAIFFNDFIKHCISGQNHVTGKTGSPVDFIAFHAKGAPTFINGHVRMNIGQQLRNIFNGFNFIASYPQLKNIPVIIGESDPDGCAACSYQTNPENGYRNGTMYSSYTAAVFARKFQLADSLHINLLRAVTWGFEFENQPWFYGFRDMSTNEVDKPVLNVFRMFGMMGGVRLKVHSNEMYPLQRVLDSSICGNTTDVGAIASKNDKSAAIMLWNYHDDDTLGAPAKIQILINGLKAKKIKVIQYRVDKGHSNAFETWKKMGSPQQPTHAQIAELIKFGKLQTIGESVSKKVIDGKIMLHIVLPRQGVALMKINFI